MLDLVPRLSIVMPVYNEGENIRLVLEAVQREVKTRPIEVLVVYDFDEDNTVPVVVGMQALFPEVRLVRNDLGRGVLNALRKGFQVARASDVLVMMADGSDEPQVVDRMVALAAAGADVVAGSRYVRGGGQRGGPPLKRTLSHLAGVSLHWLAGLPVHDATSNFRLYSRRLLGAVTIESEAGFALAIELTVKAHRLGYRIDEGDTRFAFATDNEIALFANNENGTLKDLASWCKDADLLVHDAQYSREEYKTHAGFGHSTYEEALELAEQAGAKQLAFFHHDPVHSDTDIDGLIEEALGNPTGRFELSGRAAAVRGLSG